MMHGHGQSDSPIVPAKASNKARASEEARGGETGGKGAGQREGASERQGPDAGPELPLSAVLERLREAVRKDGKARMTALYHHVSAVGHLREGYRALRRKAAPGVDGVTWEDYGRELEENLEGLSARLKRGGYRPPPVRRVYIPKGDGRQRPLGIPSLEDKIVQWVVSQVLTAIWEEEFQGFSYGFRPGRSPHGALDAVTVGIEQRPVAWILDADLRGFFDTVDHGWLVRFVEHRIGDRRMVRLLQRWLKAGVLEEGEWRESEEGTPQGGLVSPVLANIYLHYVFDLWAARWRRHAQGAVIIVRYADDFVVGFERREEAEGFWWELESRLDQFGLELHEGKTRLIEFGWNAAAERKARGEGKPETFDFLGFTHICGQTRRGAFAVLRQTVRKRLQRKLRDLKLEFRRRMHEPVPAQGAWLRRVLLGHYQYYGVPRNGDAIGTFARAVYRLWQRSLRRRSQRAWVPLERMKRLAHHWLPIPRIVHPYPDARLRLRVTP